MHRRDPSSSSNALPTRRGITAIEVLVVMVIVFLMVMVVAFALPRQRETARLVGCERNLMQIGNALALYDRMEGRLPTVPRLGTDAALTGGPLKAVLEALVLPDLTKLKDATRVPKPRPGQVPGERPVSGFVCPSDRAEGAPAPVSYRATTGETTVGTGGGFAPGRTLSLADIEAGDGRSFTAAFSERLIGTRRPDDPGLASYSLVKGPVVESGCPAAPSLSRRDDAGSTWVEASWRSTLYNHATTPGAAPSCLADDGLSARMGASSGHLHGVNVLIFDGSVRTVSPTVALPVWKALGTVGTSAQGVPLK